MADLALSPEDGSHLDLHGCSGRANLRVTENLDGGFELVVSVEVGGVAGWEEGFLELALKGVDNETALDAGVGGEDFGAVDAAELKSPFGDKNDLAVEIE